jgi:hypothetical protein
MAIKLLGQQAFRQMTKQDILSYLNSLKSPLSEDPTHKWIGSQRKADDIE